MVPILNSDENLEKLYHSYIANGNVIRYSQSGKQFGSFLKAQLCYETAIALLGTFPDKN